MSESPATGGQFGLRMLLAMTVAFAMFFAVGSLFLSNFNSRLWIVLLVPWPIGTCAGMMIAHHRVRGSLGGSIAGGILGGAAGLLPVLFPVILNLAIGGVGVWTGAIANMLFTAAVLCLFVSGIVGAVVGLASFTNTARLLDSL